MITMNGVYNKLRKLNTPLNRTAAVLGYKLGRNMGQAYYAGFLNPYTAAAIGGLVVYEMVS